MDTLQIVWFGLIGVLLAAFCITGGFDFGAGIIFGFLKEKRQREFTVQTIAPFWDGNQVWLITAGGALFAAFPKAYADILSIMYTPVIILLLLLIIRVVAIEFYAAEDSAIWRKFWQWTLFTASLFSVTLFGVALGAIFNGTVLIPTDSFLSGFLKLFTPVSVGASVLCVAFFAAHGGIFMAIKARHTQDAFPFAKLARNALYLLMAAFVIYAVILAISIKTGSVRPVNWMMGGVIAAYIPLSIAVRMFKREKYGSAFICTAAFALIIVGIHCLAAFPFIIQPVDGTAGLSISEAASSPLTLKIMLGVALTGVPLAIIYTVYSHGVFRKK